MRGINLILISSLSLTLISGTAFAQDNQIFEQGFFTQFAPRTALDMIDRLPGFQLDGSDSKRGLGQGGANILINGERLTGKTDVVSQLSRVNAANVKRIEILDGASLDIPGLSGQVANFITESNGVSGSWSWAPEFRKNQSARLGHVQLTISGENGNLSYAAELRNLSQRPGHWGPESLTQADGTVFEIRDEVNRFYSDTPGGTLDLTWNPKTDHVGNLNLEYNEYNFNGAETSNRRALTSRGEDLQTQFSSAEDEWNTKIGVDYEFPIGSGKLKTIGYYRMEHSPTINRFDVFELTGTQLSGSRFSQVADEGEAIARTEYSWAPKEGRDWQLGVEGAFNFLDIESNLFVLDGDDFVEVALDGATSRVEEQRLESTLTHSRALSTKWDIQVSLGAEYSQLSQTDGLTRTFFRPKGFLSTTYKPRKNLSIRTKIEREVGQLSFFDFISSIDVQDGLGSTGNINLVPDQSWQGSIEFDRDLGNGNTFKTKFYGAVISDLVDRIPIGIDGDAVGNIDDAYRYGFDIDVTFKGDKWGWKGTQLDLEFDLRDSKVDDPLTLIGRRLNNDKESYWRASFRHDIPETDLAYGGVISQFVGAPTYRLNTVSDYNFAGPWSTAFIEHKDVFGMKVIVSLRNLFNGTDDFKRQVFTDRRDQGVLDFTEFRSREFRRFLNIEFSGTF